MSTYKDVGINDQVCSETNLLSAEKILFIQLKFTDAILVY